MTGMICDAVVKLSMVIILGSPWLRVVPDMAAMESWIVGKIFQKTRPSKVHLSQSEALI